MVFKEAAHSKPRERADGNAISTGLNYLFVDMNSFFASVEQQVNPELRYKPVAVIPTDTVYTCCIAASYEAKAYGVKTGTMVKEAKKLCPDIAFRISDTNLYVDYHHRIIEAVESCLHVDVVASIDEMYGRLMGSERQPANAASLAHAVKQAIYTKVGEYLKCSVGIASNPWLAKVATDLQKPDGLVMMHGI